MKFFKRVANSRILRWQTVSESALILTIITFLSKIIGYLRTVLVAYYFGTSAQVDAFVVAMLIPSLVFGIIAGGLQTVIIPVYAEEKQKSLQKAKTFVNQIFLINVIILLLFSFIMFLFPTAFVKIVAYGFKGARLSQAAYFMRFLIVFGFFNVLAGLFIGLLQAEKQFLFPALTLLIGNSLIPLSLLLFAKRIGINSWTIGEISFGTFSFSVMFLFLYYKKQFFRSFELLQINFQKVLDFFVLLFPIILTSGVTALYKIVDKTVASSLPVGSVAALNFAQLIYQIPFSIFIVPIVYAVYPYFASFAAKGTNSAYKQLFEKTFFVLMFITIPILFLFDVYAKPLVRILYQHGAFTSTSTSLTAFAVSMYSLGLFTVSANFLFQRVFFSFKDTKTPLYITIFVVIFNAVGDVLLSRIMGVGGIGLATALATIVGFVTYIVMLKKKHFLPIPYGKFLKEGFKITLSSTVMLIVGIPLISYVNYSADFFTLVIRFSLVIVLLLTFYALSAYLFKSTSLIIFIQYVKRFVRKVKNAL